ncbi:sensor histidine kinase [Marivita sp. S2033]|uniref:sensor histidine kinase n=1 Tax=Marivita sp. S2033 TaxID=3373187 RepID=UPI0039828A5C
MKLDFEAIFNQSPAPKMVLDDKLIFVEANDAYLRMTGRTRDEVIGQYAFDAFPESEERVESMKAVFMATLEGEEITLSEVPYRILKNGVVTEAWWTFRHSRVEDKSKSRRYITQYGENVTEAMKMRQMRDALMGEMQHRIGNLFTLVGAIARQTARQANDVPSFLSEFETRLASLVKVNRRLTGDVDSDETMAGLIDHSLAVYPEAVRERIKVSGPDYKLSVMQSQAISMALHELSTNSMKYGAISHPDGHVSILWDALPNDRCLLRWQESGVPEETPSHEKRKQGYGTMLLDTIIPSQLNGTGTRDFATGTFSYTLEIGASEAD